MTANTGPSPSPDAVRIIIVGGVAGGMSAAARARRLDEHAQIVVLEQGNYVSFANCGLPYHLSGEIAARDELLLHTPESLAASLNLDVRTGHRVTGIDRTPQKVTIQTGDGSYALPYDALVLSPGAVAVRPAIEGLNHPAVHTCAPSPTSTRSGSASRICLPTLDTGSRPRHARGPSSSVPGSSASKQSRPSPPAASRSTSSSWPTMSCRRLTPSSRHCWPTSSPHTGSTCVWECPPKPSRRLPPCPSHWAAPSASQGRPALPAP